MQSFYSNGKLLLTGEYVVLDGAKALALPTKYGQSLIVNPITEQKLYWKSFNSQGKVWFEDELSVKTLKKSFTLSNNDVLRRLFEIIISAKQLNDTFLSSDSGSSVTTQLDFPNNWGLGSSSTLINNVAQWAQVDAYKLLEMTFGGSGYDIACAQNATPIFYQKNNDVRTIKPITFKPQFEEHLYFLHLNKKQNSGKAITHYNTKSVEPTNIKRISSISNAIVDCSDFDMFCSLMDEHEQILSKILNMPTIKTQLFPDFSGSIKSLGAWGGDFVLVGVKDDPIPYFSSKGYNTIITFGEMIL